MLVLHGNIGILPKDDVKSDVGQRWQGLAGRGERRANLSFAMTSAHHLFFRDVGVHAHDHLLAVHHAICFLVAVG